MHTIDTLTATQLAAGPTLDRPAAVLRELIENALDAGARHIDVHLADGAIVVSDDGCGMSSAELEMAFLRHTTSKLHTFADVFQLNTLGFRGEALATIAAVARVSCTSRTATTPIATEVRIAGGEVQDMRSCAHAVGTTIQVERLFYTAPQQRDFWGHPQHEGQHLHDTVVQYACLYPEVAFRLYRQQRMMLATTGSGALADVVTQVWGVAVQHAFAGSLSGYAASVTGVTLAGEAAHAQRRHQIVAINRRPVRVQGYLARIIDEVCPPSPYAHPGVIVDFTLPRADIDINVAAHKHAVRVRHPGVLARLLHQAITPQPLPLAAVATWAPLPSDLTYLGDCATALVLTAADGIYLLNPARILSDQPPPHGGGGQILSEPIDMATEPHTWGHHWSALCAIGFAGTLGEHTLCITAVPEFVDVARFRTACSPLMRQIAQGHDLYHVLAACARPAWVIAYWRTLADPWQRGWCMHVSTSHIRRQLQLTPLGQR